MLISYNITIGKLTTKSVNISDVGVIMAAIIKIATYECLRYLRIMSDERMFIFPNSQESRGISKTIPMANESMTRVSIYDWSDIMLATSELT